MRLISVSQGQRARGHAAVATFGRPGSGVAMTEVPFEAEEMEPSHVFMKGIYVLEIR